MNLPDYFRSLFWDIDFDSVSPDKNKKLVITKTINYGNLKHWKWISDYYGKNLPKSLQEIPRSEFRQPALKLASLIYNLDDLKYASRSAYIQSKKNNCDTD